MEPSLELDQELQPAGRTGYVALAGKPNVGKSTLMNAFLGQKIAAVTFRPQTTRKQQFGILTRGESQAVFIDTPGIHRPHHKLGEQMNAEAALALEDANILLILLDVSSPPDENDMRLAETIADHAPNRGRLVVLNKIDRVDKEKLAANRVQYLALFPAAECLEISAQRGTNLDILVDRIFELLPEGFPFYPEDQLTDLYEREISADLIREAALLNLRDEVPHSIAIRIDEFTERGDKGAYIAATLFVERESQIGIVVGKRGMMLKKIGSHARKEIEEMSGRKVHLQLRVKLRKNWRNDPKTLRSLGFKH